MLVAEKYQTYDGTEAYALPLPKTPQSPRPAAKPQSRALQKAVSIVMVFICFFAACLTIARYARIAENHREILRLRQSLEQELDRMSRLQVDLAFKKDLNNVELAARENLGMDHPGTDQVQYVQLPEVQEAPERMYASEKPSPGLLSRLLGIME